MGQALCDRTGGFGAEDYSWFRIRVDFDDDRGERFEVKDRFEILSERAGGVNPIGTSFTGAMNPNALPRPVDGRGRNLSIMIASEDEEVTPPHVISGMTVYYVMRRMRR